MELESKIVEVIKENLTSSQVGLLKDYFATAEKVSAELKDLRPKFDKLSEEAKELRSKVGMFEAKERDFDAARTKVRKREEEINKKELAFERDIAVKELEMCKNSYGEMKTLIGSVFRNPRFIHEDSVHRSGYTGEGGHWVGDQSTTKTTTTEQE